MEPPTWARRRKPETAKADLKPLSCNYFGGQGVRGDPESEGHEEKYRAVVDGGCPEDEPVGQRWDQVEPALWRRRRTHSPTAPRCVRTARYGRAARDLRRTGGVGGWRRRSEPISASEMESEALPVVGRLNSTLKRGQHHGTEQSATELGRGRQPAKIVGKKEKARGVRM